MGVGERVAAARVEAGLTQAQLASAIGIARSALAKIETGLRGVSAVELVAIGRELGRRVEWFVDPGPPAIVSYRTARHDMPTQAIDAGLDRIARDVSFVVGKCPDLIAGQPEIRTAPTSAAEADELAADARSLLGLGPGAPVHDLSRLVTAIGLLPFALRLGDGADAGTVLLPTGGVAVVNGDLKVGRRRLALAHELGHYLIADQYTTDWRVAAIEADTLEACLDRFARALLLPEEDLRVRWRRWLDDSEEPLRDAAVHAGSHYQVDMATLARRLDELDLIDKDQVAAVRNVRTKRADIVEKNLVIAREMEPVSLPRSYEQAVLRLYRHEVLSAERALALLLDTFDRDSLPDLPPVPEAEIWAFVS